MLVGGQTFFFCFWVHFSLVYVCLNLNHWVLCSSDSQEVIDAELSARVLRLVNVSDTGLHSQVCTGDKASLLRMILCDLILMRSTKFHKLHKLFVCCGSFWSTHYVLSSTSDFAASFPWILRLTKNTENLTDFEWFRNKIYGLGHRFLSFFL